jgi:hypothetical protein
VRFYVKSCCLEEAHSPLIGISNHKISIFWI